MDHANAIEKAAILAGQVAPKAEAHDRAGSFCDDGVEALAKAGLMGLMVPKDAGGEGLGPKSLAAVITAVAEADASLGMVYLMHVLGTNCVVSGRKSAARDKVLAEVVAGKHLSTLAFSEAGSRSHFWAPISKAEMRTGGSRLNAKKSWVTSAGKAQSYIVSSLSPSAKTPVESNLYLVSAGTPGVTVAAAWDGMGLRANASSPMGLEAVDVSDDARLTEDGKGFDAMMGWVLPLFCLGSACVALGISRAAVAATVKHLKISRFEHMGDVSLGEALPNARARLAQMQIETDGLASRIEDTIRHLESPGDLTMLRVLEVKAAGGEVATSVTSTAMRACGGAAFSKHTSIERLFRDAHAGTVMAPTVDVLHDFIGKALLGIPLF